MSNFLSGNNNEKNESGGNNIFSQVGVSKESFENTNNQNNSLNNQYQDLEQNYQKIFIEAAESIRKAIDEFKPKDACKTCVKKKDCKIESLDVFSPFPPSGCKYRDWQLQALTFLAGDYRQRLKAEYKAIMDKKSKYECNKCAECCRLAVSEFSYEQLRQRASRGDKYSQDFVTIFVPYKSEEDAKNANPEYFELLNNIMEEEKVYYYFCPKLEGNLCSIYENRPDICKDFPHNPLKLLPSKCSFNEWRNEVSHASMLLKAKVDIISFYKGRLQ